MITPEIKDKVLNDFIKTGIHISQDIDLAQEEFGISSDYLGIIIDQFESMGLLTQTKFLGGEINIDMKAAAFDLQARGGFVAAEEIVKATLEKLQLEILSLQKEYPDRALQFTQILSNMATIGTFFMTRQ